jgi:hypothetical protein
MYSCSLVHSKSSNKKVFFLLAFKTQGMCLRTCVEGGQHSGDGLVAEVRHYDVSLETASAVAQAILGEEESVEEPILAEYCL